VRKALSRTVCASAIPASTRVRATWCACRFPLHLIACRQQRHAPATYIFCRSGATRPGLAAPPSNMHKYTTGAFCAYFFAILFLVLLAWAVNEFVRATRAPKEECNRYCGSQVTQGVFYTVGAAVALAAMIGCSVMAGTSAGGKSDVMSTPMA